MGGDSVPQVGARPVRPPDVEPVDGDHPVDHVGEDGGPRAIAEAHGDDTAATVTAHRSIETDEPRRRAEGGGSQPEPPRRRGECPCRRSELNGGRGRRRDHPSLLRLLWHTPMMTRGCNSPAAISRRGGRRPTRPARQRTRRGSHTTGTPIPGCVSAVAPRTGSRPSVARRRACDAASSATHRP